MKAPKIETERLLLRTYTNDDLEDVYSMITDPDVTRFFPEGYSVKKEDVLASLPRRMEKWHNYGFGQFGVFEKKGEKLIGYCGLQYLDDTSEVEIYYGYLKNFWGKGIATEAGRSVLRFGFETVGLERVVAVTHPENYASQRVLQRLGMEREHGLKRFYNVDTAYFSLSKQYFEDDGASYKLEYIEIND